MSHAPTYHDPTYRDLATAILVAHQRHGAGGCLCRDLALGKSWAAHVAELLDDAGALRRKPPAENEGRA